MKVLKQLLYIVLIVYDVIILLVQKNRRDQMLSPWDVLICGKRNWLHTNMDQQRSALKIEMKE